VEVWQRREPPAVAVSFGGTVFNNPEDWLSNLRWFIPVHDDEYSKVVRNLGPAFVAEFVSRAGRPGGEFLRKATIYATGHSLGGGLAQQFAYSMPNTDGVQRVGQVYAFDPSPVTGFYSVPVSLRDINKQNLLIDRIYEQGEILASLRSVMTLIYPPTATAPSIRAVRYSLFYPATPLAGHSIAELACGLQYVAGRASDS